jgi:hypothetical protein
MTNFNLPPKFSRSTPMAMIVPMIVRFVDFSDGGGSSLNGGGSERLGGK